MRITWFIRDLHFGGSFRHLPVKHLCQQEGGAFPYLIATPRAFCILGETDIAFFAVLNQKIIFVPLKNGSIKREPFIKIIL